MAFRTKVFTSPQRLDQYLNGWVVGGRSLLAMLVGGKVLGLHGLTLIINTTTVTFSDASGAGLTLSAIRTQIQSAVAGVTAAWEAGQLVLSASGGVTVDKDGTANTLFGFDVSVDTAATPINGPNSVSLPRIVAIGGAPQDDGYYVTVETA